MLCINLSEYWTSMDFGELYISWYSAQFLSLPYTSFTKNIFEFEVLNANTSRFAPCRIVTS